MNDGFLKNRKEDIMENINHGHTHVTEKEIETAMYGELSEMVGPNGGYAIRSKIETCDECESRWRNWVCRRKNQICQE
ncbi:MAG: hypothetical protein A2174_01345 [Candidatus Portnoybacteria bacterium RBG_13_41_18]|uniref:Uncharacterized protein n=1 Tax=Candidatus Portnoybacteria bacterium RBG_13_41_18 TaxID=1801991 RepID=A0A1G2F5Y3_9BACT|nr:MAG: hypothetical protein A2174_01345 [Candidatus Portnoybacteria bacterium RBG_13_41_18]